jgi:hypothetical protein
MTLDDVLCRIATIHQQHSAKCWLALQDLNTYLTFTPNEWNKLSTLLSTQEPKIDLAILQSDTVPVLTSIRRRHWLLSHALYPHAYFTMQQWMAEDGAEAVFKYYLEDAAKENNYLGHHVSILLSWIAIWPHIRSAQQRWRFIERFTEFVTSTYYGNNRLVYAASPDTPRQSNLEQRDVIRAVINKPGFWGHNLIATAVVMRYEDSLTPTQRENYLNQILEQTLWVYQDAEDSPDISHVAPLNTDDATLTKSLRALLFEPLKNLHQITLAWGVLTLFKHPSIEIGQHSKLINIADHFSRS